MSEAEKGSGTKGSGSAKTGKDGPQEEEEEEFIEPKHVWTHPQHIYVCLIGFACKLVGTLFTIAACFILKPMYDHDNNRIALGDVFCHENGVCMTQANAKKWTPTATTNIEDFKDLKANSGPIQIVNDYGLLFFMPASDGIDVLVFTVFWIYYLATGKVINFILEMLVTMVMVPSWIKLVVGFFLVSAIPKINHVYMWGTTLVSPRNRLYQHDIYERALRLDPLMMSFLFFSFILDTVTFAMMLVARDKGLTGMSHRKRLMMEQEAIKREEEMEMQPDRRKSYAPEEMSHHDRRLSEISMAKKKDEQEESPANILSATVKAVGSAVTQATAKSIKSK